MQKDVLSAGEAMERQQNQHQIGAKADSSQRDRRGSSCSSSFAGANSDMNVDDDSGDHDHTDDQPMVYGNFALYYRHNSVSIFLLR